LKQAMSGLRPPGFSPIDPRQGGTPRGRSRSNTPRTQSPRNVKSRVFDFMTPSPGGSTQQFGGDRSLSPSPASRGRSGTGGAPSPADTLGRSGRSDDRSKSPIPGFKRQATNNPDTDGWVHIPTFNRFMHAGGRPWSKTDSCEKVMQREVMLKDSWHAKKFETKPKITSGWDHDRAIKELRDTKRDFANKPNVPDAGARLSIRRVSKDCSGSKYPSKKITSKAVYGQYPNYKESTDRIYLKGCSLKSRNPDLKHEQMETNPSFTKITNSAAPSPRSAAPSPRR